jgi:hypothetical protein
VTGEPEPGAEPVEADPAKVDAAKVVTPAFRVEPPDPREVALDRCIGEIERELGPLGLYSRIAIGRAVEAFGDAVAWHNRDPCDPWH